MSRRLALAAAASLALLLSGCHAITRAVPVAMPAELVGNWQAVADSGTKPFPVRFGPHDAAFGLDCGVVTGLWQARPGGLLVVVPLSVGSCYHQGTDVGRSLPAWFTSAVSFRTRGAQRVLQDLNGKTLVTLTPDIRGALPDPEPPTAGGLEGPTVVVRPAFGPARLPAQFGDLLGRWRDPNDGAGAEVSFRYDGFYGQNDGCNRQGGRWVAESGAFLALQAGTTLKYCTKGTDLLAGVTSMAKAGSRLILFDRSGKQLRELWFDGDA